MKNKKVTSCWLEEMDLFVQEYTKGTIDLKLPLDDEEQFMEYFQLFLDSEEGQTYLKARDLVVDFDSGRIKFMRISAESAGESQSTRAEKIPIRDGWDEYVRKI